MTNTIQRKTRFVGLGIPVCSLAFWLLTIGTLPADIMMSPQAGKIKAGTILHADANEKLRPAMEALQAGNMQLFVSSYEAAAKDVPELPTIEIFIAKQQIESGRIGDAINGLDRFLAKNPDSPEGYFALGEIALRSNRLTEAAMLLDRAQQLCDDGKLPENRKTNVLMGLIAVRAEVAERRQLWDNADSLYKLVIDSSTDASEFMWRRGRMLVLKGEVEQGVFVMSQALTKNSKLPSPELTAALILAEKRDAAGAEKWFHAAIKSERADWHRWSEYLKWLLSNERPADARKAIDRLEPALRKERAIMLLDGVTARCLDDLETAETVFSILHQSNPSDLEAADQLANVLVESKDEAKRSRALQLSEGNLRQAPNVENAVATAAWVQFKLGSVDVADRMLAELASKIAISPQTAYYISEVMKAKGNVADARKILQAAVNNPGIFAQRIKAVASLILEP